MSMDKAKRKRRSDRRHAVYSIQNILTGEQYIGITVCQGAAVQRSLKIRWQKHVRRALTEDKNWLLCEAIREWGAECFDIKLVELIRGRRPAHQRERALIAELAPKLNTF
jgi:hypothetical protein